MFKLLVGNVIPYKKGN